MISVHQFYEHYIYKGFILVNDIYEDDDCRKNCWMWTKATGQDNEVVKYSDLVDLKGLSSNSYAPWEEVWKNFTNMVDQLLTSK